MQENNKQETATHDTKNEYSKKQDSHQGKLRHLTRGANDLSLGISIIVAVLLGFGLGYGFYKLTGYYWLIWLGLGYGVAAAILNVVKAYKRLHRELDSLKNDKKYSYIQEKTLELEKQKSSHS